MKGLLFKDRIELIRIYRSFFLISFVFMAMSFFSRNYSFWAVYGVFMISTMVSSIHSADESQKWSMYCDILPMDRSVQVTEKFLYAGFLIFGCAAVYAVMWVVMSFFHMAPPASEMFIIIVAMILTGILSSSVSLMFAFWFGYQKNQLVRMGVIMIMVMFGVAILNNAGTVLDWLSAVSPIVLALGTAAVILIVSFLCWKIACVKYEQRQL